ncbi:Transcriptional regulator of ribosomal biogenesis protein [Linnemannia gamsii]|uniref:Transcriptional regulator of ribosomal biogenesis protein n=1 Tax=Linnemannia gamsii TaxID=64522 RepID=A0ABQ7K228_9FUNG|nr:Transcriptional regulator of ribosomal biogenesis protein [Linnemannia gamsii]
MSPRRESDFEQQLSSPMLGVPGASLRVSGAGIAAAAETIGGGGDHTNHARELETSFCRDFYCCGLTLMDLHDLLQHYEECHVRFEEDENCGLSVDGGGGDSEFFDEDNWSDSESMTSSSGSSSSPLGSGSSLSMSSRSTGQHYNLHRHQSHFQQYPSGSAISTYKQSSVYGSASFFIPPSPSSLGGGGGGGGSGRTHHRLHADNINSTTHALEIFSTSLGGVSKRKAVVSLSDIYAEDDVGYEHDDGDPSSAFMNTILRTRSTNANNGTSSSNVLGPPTKRQVLDPAQQQQRQYSHHQSQQQQRPHSMTGGPAFIVDRSQNSNGYAFASANSNSDNTSNKNTNNHSNSSAGGLMTGVAGAHGRGSALGSLSNIRPNMFHEASGSAASSAPAISGISLLTSSTQSPYVAAAADLIRQRDEVFSIIEDMTKVPPNASSENKPYRCSVTGCDKAYKNPNGLKYHNLHGHCSNGVGDGDSPESKPYVCTFLECGKRYKNLNGLKYHIEHTHPNLIAALRAHQSGLANHPLIVNGPFANGSAAAMTIAAALAAVEASPMMALAANAILTAQAAAANQAIAAAAAAASEAVTTASESAAPSSGQSSNEGAKVTSDSEPTTMSPLDEPFVSTTGSGLPQAVMAISGSLESASTGNTGIHHNMVTIAPTPQDRRTP